MKNRIAIAGTVLCMAAGAGLANAQAGPVMWCYADVGDGANSSRVYSELFSAASDETAAKARAFARAAEEAEVSAAEAAATCVAASDHNSAVQARNAARQEKPGEVIDWAG
jgi:hypothetical protein